MKNSEITDKISIAEYSYIDSSDTVFSIDGLRKLCDEYHDYGNLTVAVLRSIESMQSKICIAPKRQYHKFYDLRKWMVLPFGIIETTIPNFRQFLTAYKRIYKKDTITFAFCSRYNGHIAEYNTVLHTDDGYAALADISGFNFAETFYKSAI